MSVNTADTARRLSCRKPTRCSTSIRLILVLVVSISYSFVCIDAGKTGLPRCSCLNGASCDTETGTCLCSKGYQGDNCNTTCPEGTHGFKCEKNCTCPINSVCSPIDGSCSCKYEYKYNGTHCECHPNNNIPGCEACNCSQWGTCDLTTGKCMCPQEGYTGQSCRKLHCGNKTYVLGCQGNCQCQYNGTCYKIDGSCDCLPGWMGKNCSNGCPDGYYGNNCQSYCTCENSKSCDPVTGKCICLPGRTGKNCSNGCPDGYYGNNCLSNCTCENSKSCDPVTGKCICLPGWTGKNCTTVCPDNDVSSTELGDDLSPNVIALISAFALVLVCIVVAFCISGRRSRAEYDAQAREHYERMQSSKSGPTHDQNAGQVLLLSG